MPTPRRLPARDEAACGGPGDRQTEWGRTSSEVVGAIEGHSISGSGLRMTNQAPLGRDEDDVPSGIVCGKFGDGAAQRLEVGQVLVGAQYATSTRRLASTDPRLGSPDAFARCSASHGGRKTRMTLRSCRRRTAARPHRAGSGRSGTGSCAARCAASPRTGRCPRPRAPCQRTQTLAVRFRSQRRGASRRGRDRSCAPPRSAASGSERPRHRRRARRRRRRGGVTGSN